jgi:hypothetical protein
MLSCGHMGSIHLSTSNVCGEIEVVDCESIVSTWLGCVAGAVVCLLEESVEREERFVALGTAENKIGDEKILNLGWWKRQQKRSSEQMNPTDNGQVSGEQGPWYLTGFDMLFERATASSNSPSPDEDRKRLAPRPGAASLRWRLLLGESIRTAPNDCRVWNAMLGTGISAIREDVAIALRAAKAANAMRLFIFWERD